MDTRLLCPWDFLGKSTGVGCHCLLQGKFPTQGWNPGHCRQTLYHLSHQGSPFTKATQDIILWEIDGETVETVSDSIFGGSKITADVDCSHEMKICLLLGRKAMTNLDSILKSRDIANKGLSSQSYGSSSSHVWMWELDHIESWALKNLSFWKVVLEKTLESPSDCNQI